MLRAFFIALSENKSLRHFSESSFMGQKLSRRFVAGMSVEDCLNATAEVNKLGMSVSVDNLGENVTNAEEAKASARLYHQMMEAVHDRKLNANVSLKLTHMGFDVDAKLATDITASLVEKAASLGSFVRVDMEGSSYTQRTLDMVHELHKCNGFSGRVGAVIQAYMRRSESDVEKLLADKIRIRLCKGAYKEPADIAYPEKSDVDTNYVKLMKMLLKSGVYHGIATHDENMIQATKDFAKQENIPNSAYEFQMLYGVRRDLQQQLVKDGYNMRVYIPFGTEWYPYFMRRLAERPANAMFVLKNLFMES